MPHHSNVIILQQLLQASGKNVASEDGIAAACFSGGCAFSLFHRPGVLVFWWMGLSGEWGPLPIPGARFTVEWNLIDPFVGTLLDHALQDGSQQHKLVRCVLAILGQQGGYYTR